MGGLVGRRAVNELCRKGKPAYLRVYVSIDTPYRGVELVSGAVKRGTELVPSWVDVASGSPFLTGLHKTPLPKDLPFHLFFGWGQHGEHGPGPAGDGTITLPSQLDPRAQAVKGFDLWEMLKPLVEVRRQALRAAEQMRRRVLRQAAETTASQG